jgi:carboxymethylenebutenolidase
VGEMITVSSDGVAVSGYVSRPPVGKGPGVVVIQEWWGLVPQIKSIADRFAQAGFLAMVPDLYHGNSAKSPDAAGKLMMAMNIAKTEKDLAAAVAFVKEHPDNSNGKAGVIGFCMGGALALYAATKNPEVSACVVFYGGHPKVEPDLPSLHAPLLGIYAGNDRSVSTDLVRGLEEKLKQLEKTSDIHIYPGTDHAFFNDERPEVYNREAAEDAWKRTLDFFRKHLMAVPHRQ